MTKRTESAGHLTGKALEEHIAGLWKVPPVDAGLAELLDGAKPAYACSICGATRPDSEDALGWKLVWQMPLSCVVSVRLWDQTVAAIPMRYPACSLECAMKKVKELLTEVELKWGKELEAYKLTPPEPKSKQTDFDPGKF